MDMSASDDDNEEAYATAKDSDDMEESDEDAQGEADDNPYPLEGKYKDAADRDRCVEGAI